MRPFYGVSQAQLEVWLDDVRAEMASGKTRTKVGSDALDVEYQINTSPVARMRLIYAELNRLDSSKYPLTAIRPINRTHAKFYGS